MNKLCCASFVLAFAFSWTADASSIWDIRLPANAKPYEKKAASDLKAYLDRIARCRLSVDGSSDAVFHVGDTDFARSKGYVSEWMPDEWWMVKSYGADVILNGGGKPRNAVCCEPFP